MKLPLKQYPFYIKSTVVLLGLVLLSISLSNLRDILSPIAFSLILAILLNPLVNKMQKKGVNKVVAISLALTLTLLIIAGIFYFIS
ncbi:MAG: AI-2E family transporter, partial [Ferruginibacter sp.]